MNQTTSNARLNILNKLKSQLQGADLSKLPQEVKFEYPTKSHYEQLEMFSSHLKTNHAKVIYIDRYEIAQQVKQELDSRGLSSLLYGSQSHYGQDIEKLDSVLNLQTYDFQLADNKDFLFDEVEASISGSCCAIAATGTIVLKPDAAEPRSLSLVPPLHFIIVDSRHLYLDLASALKSEDLQPPLPTNIVFVSGPSKTADIQQTLAYGAHGPKELIVLLIKE